MTSCFYILKENTHSYTNRYKYTKKNKESVPLRLSLGLIICICFVIPLGYNKWLSRSFSFNCHIFCFFSVFSCFFYFCFAGFFLKFSFVFFCFPLKERKTVFHNGSFREGFCLGVSKWFVYSLNE